MKETMDGAAKNAQKVAQHILPERPHHLSLSFDRRFPAPDGFWFTGASGPLQYMTYISAAQRGILTTRAAFEICDEVVPPPMSTKILAKGEVKKKLSLMDYQNKKKSASPVENGGSVKTEARTNGTLPAKPPPPKDGFKKEDLAKKEDGKAAERPNDPRQADTRSEKPRPETNGERYVESAGRSWYGSWSTDGPIESSHLSRSRIPRPREASVPQQTRTETPPPRNEPKPKLAPWRPTDHDRPSQQHHEVGRA